MKVMTARPGHEGSGYVGEWQAVDDRVRVPEARCPSVGRYKLRCRYACSMPTGATRSIYVDNVKQQAVTFPANASGDTDNVWSVREWEVPLSAGPHVIDLLVDAGQGGKVDLDWIELALPAVAQGGANVVQFEAGSWTDAQNWDPIKVATDFAGFNGAGYVTNAWKPGDKVMVDVTVPTAGRYHFSIRYTNVDDFAFSKVLSVNGADAGRVGPFTRAQSYGKPDPWREWLTTVPFQLNAGVNKLAFTTLPEMGNAYLDQLTVTGPVA